MDWSKLTHNLEAAFTIPKLTTCGNCLARSTRRSYCWSSSGTPAGRCRGTRRPGCSTSARRLLSEREHQSENDRRREIEGLSIEDRQRVIENYFSQAYRVAHS